MLIEEPIIKTIEIFSKILRLFKVAIVTSNKVDTIYYNLVKVLSIEALLAIESALIILR